MNQSMGKPNPQQSDQTSITHFSHPHPLHLTNLQTSGPIPQCSACNLAVSGSVYTCKSCDFYLHSKCYQLPRKIKHPFHQNHTLFLQPKPVYPEGLFNCDACGNQGSGFSYHCSPCGLDLHTTCASLPLQFTHQCHHHQLCLTFAAPYNGNTFACDICKRSGSKTWIYRCNACEFDVHLTCVATVIPVVFSRQPSNLNSPPNMVGYSGPPGWRNVAIGQAPNQFAVPYNNNLNQFAAPYNVAIGQAPNQFAAPYNNNLNQAAYGAARPANGGGIGNQLMVGAVNGIASGAAQSAAQVLLQGLFGGGGGGGGGASGGGGSDVSHVDVMGMGGGGGIMDGGSYYDGGYGGGDGGYIGGDGSY
ncbi:hypothetical protein CDL12_02079 [Handroanthus impetiginosus]|uniref:DC1 domain-containing protein n=1 Tax=Handroanthus impetiginosus TaxID=429701 RepID=A0A2G9I5Z2_9LAMI|nr:hypothetical protein CDL12_02079 [Handroanthus impetiginosus]